MVSLPFYVVKVTDKLEEKDNVKSEEKFFVEE
jgi:hypothetical protein